MGRDDKKGKSNNKDTLPQTPKNLKIKPKEVQTEFSRELDALHENKNRKSELSVQPPSEFNEL